ncbi:hypothetical protein O9G_002372 [Rozella allomycis CSF55]|uniref:Uncharacterized protein n=1 Tax=Rozella allomycis (strain CSF55) TaxID=988480 RepID=A0A075AYW0_ROZAC|nr:hypothetical protein O9G_002372 [Rozella allomycis CSF55]|eukprot:EPZ33734.1 hypothetical protein O9G_002372 [Rozella allomycis CSF55]
MDFVSFTVQAADYALPFAKNIFNDNMDTLITTYAINTFEGRTEFHGKNCDGQDLKLQKSWITIKLVFINSANRADNDNAQMLEIL